MSVCVCTFENHVADSVLLHTYLAGDRGADDRINIRLNYVFGDDGFNLTRPERDAAFNASARAFCIQVKAIIRLGFRSSGDHKV